jgi:hypothetical protein
MVTLKDLYDRAKANDSNQSQQKIVFVKEDGIFEDHTQETFMKTSSSFFHHDWYFLHLSQDPRDTIWMNLMNTTKFIHDNNIKEEEDNNHKYDRSAKIKKISSDELNTISSKVCRKEYKIWKGVAKLAIYDVVSGPCEQHGDLKKSSNLSSHSSSNFCDSFNANNKYMSKYKLIQISVFFTEPWLTFHHIVKWVNGGRSGIIIEDAAPTTLKKRKSSDMTKAKLFNYRVENKCESHKFQYHLHRSFSIGAWKTSFTTQQLIQVSISMFKNETSTSFFFLIFLLHNYRSHFTPSPLPIRYQLIVETCSKCTVSPSRDG